jgi:hypothetical protein
MPLRAKSKVQPLTKRRRTLTLPLPPIWVLSQIALIVIVAGLVWCDREYWHWYSPDRQPLMETISSVSDLEDRLGEVESDVIDAGTRASSAEAKAAAAIKVNQSFGATDSVEASLVRMANSLAIVSLVQQKGGSQSSGSAQGQACINWFLKGEGSLTDCGFVRTDR